MSMWQKASMKLNASTTLKNLSEREKKQKVIEAFKKTTIREEVSTFFNETSFTAVQKIYNANHWAKRLTWTVLVLAMVSWLVVQCYWLMAKYFEYPVEVKIDLKATSSMEFPSVTFCNLNPIREGALDDENFKSLRVYRTPPTEDLLYRTLQENFRFNEICEKNEYQCLNGHCFPIEYRCDLYVDCIGGEDEENCNEAYTCPDGYFHCPNYICVINESLCDGYGDCLSPKYEDEVGCPGGSPFWNSRHTTGSNSSYPAYSTTSPPPNHYLESSTATISPSHLGHGRRKRDAHHKKPTARRKGRTNNFYQKMKSAVDDMKTRLINGKISQNSYNEFLTTQKMRLKNQQMKIMNRRSKQEELRVLRRAKRSGGGSSDSRETIDWAEVLGNTTFNRWNELIANSAYYTERDDHLLAVLTYAYVTATANEELVKQAGHLKDDFIASCQFNGYQCSPENFTYFHSYMYGSCYTFNAVGENRDLITNFPGPGAGLRVELFVEQDDYVPNLAAEAGVRVTIHKKGTKPFPEDIGMSIQPRTSTSIGLKLVVLDRLPPPHGTCGEATITDYYVKYGGFEYTKLSCLKSCYQDIIRDKCGCDSPIYFMMQNHSVCNLTDTAVDRCLANTLHNNVDRYHACDTQCPPPCQETHYQTSFSDSEWPSRTYEEFFQDRMGKSNFKYLLSKNIKNDFLRVQIYFEDFLYEHIQQQKGYESMNLISDLGGQLGLWLGLSAITIGEICSFLFRLGRSVPSALSGEEAKDEIALKPNKKVAPVTLEEMYEDMSKNISDDMLPPRIVKPRALYS